MLKRTRLQLLTLTLLMAAGLTACEKGLAPDRLTGPADSYSTGEVSWTTTAVKTSSPVAENTVTMVIGSRGGVMRNGDHSLYVPSKAVPDDTEFTFKVVGGNIIQVDFSAKRVRDGATVSTFAQSLTLRLSYKNAIVSDPSRLFIAYLLEGAMAGAKERLPSTVSTFTQTVSAQLWHFSGYEMGQD